MTEKKFGKIINEIQKFMGLDNWEITYQVTDIDKGDDETTTDAECTAILYDYFTCNIQFNTDMVKNDDDDYVMHIIFHELSHIYTTTGEKVFEKNNDFTKQMMGNILHEQIKRQMSSVNEQQTELLARRFKELYLKTK